MSAPPAHVLSAYGFSPQDVQAISGGLINDTYIVRGRDGNAIAALQRLHPVFAAEVNLDIEAITDYLASQHLQTPRLIRTLTGDAWCMAEDRVWRAITWIDGQCYDALSAPEQAKQAAALVGRFHRILDTFDYSFVFSRGGVHDTEAHFKKLHEANSTNSDEVKLAALRLRQRIFEQKEKLTPLPSLPTRICHGDLKISNLLFDHRGSGLCLIDLDTLSYQNIAYELGDALRSWGNRAGEDMASPDIDSDIISAAAHGYAQGSQGLLSQAEINSVIPGLEIICLELAIRFCTDIFEDCYFGWDPANFPSRRHHNLKRAQGQLALCQSVAQKRQILQDLWISPFAKQ